MATLSNNISDLATAVATEIKKINTDINGNDGSRVSRLNTTATTIVDAINEVKNTADSAAGGGTSIDDNNVRTDATYSSSKIESVVSTATTNLKAELLGGADEALDTLKELGDALANNEDAVSALTTQVASKAPIASPTFTGTPKAPTPALNDNSTNIATTAFVQQEIGDYTTTTFVETFQAGLQ